MSLTVIEITVELMLFDVSLTEMFREYMPKSSRVLFVITPVSALIVKLKLC